MAGNQVQTMLQGTRDPSAQLERGVFVVVLWSNTIQQRALVLPECSTFFGLLSHCVLDEPCSVLGSRKLLVQIVAFWRTHGARLSSSPQAIFIFSYSYFVPPFPGKT